MHYLLKNRKVVIISAKCYFVVLTNYEHIVVYCNNFRIGDYKNKLLKSLPYF